MIESLNIILDQGKSTLIKNIQYLSAKDYIQPFVDRLKPLNPTFRCNVKIADQLVVTNNTPEIVYNRVHIQAILPEEYYYKNECRKVVGMIYGLDVKKPVAKFYIGDIDDKNNLIVFDENCIKYQDIEDSTALNYSCIKELLEYVDTNAVMMSQIDNVYYDLDNIQNDLGGWIDYILSAVYPSDYGIVKLATSLPITAYKWITKNKDSDYYCDKNPKFSTIYKAMLQVITDENDIMNTFEKTILIKRMLRL